jgi:hypothetical protein
MKGKKDDGAVLVDKYGEGSLMIFESLKMYSYIDVIMNILLIGKNY